jgi:Gpi18-like mannosyltransferase
MLILWFIFLNAVNAVSLKALFDRTSYELPKGISLPLRHITVPWLNFDGRNYLKIAADGYDRGYQTDLRVFFPMYPLLIRILSFNFFLNPILTGLVISAASFVAAVFVLNLILKTDKMKEDKRLRTLLTLLVFPTSFYFLAFYTESLFLLLVLLTFYFLGRKNFLAASLVTAVASATRVTGLALIIPLAYEVYSEYKKSGKFLPSVFMAPLGLVFYALYIQLFGGGALSIIASQKNWNKPLGIFGPLVAMKDGFIKFLYGSTITRGDFYGRSMEIFEFIFAVLLLVFIVYSYKKIKMTYWLYMAAATLPIFFSGVLSSVHRYMAVMFPIYILVGSLPKKYFYITITASSLILIYLASLFLRGYWVA